MRSRTPDLERLAASQLASCLEQTAIGSPLAIDSASNLCDTLELLIPEVLRREHSEWERESLDGFFFATTVKNDAESADLAGTCILISDQTVTPFLLSVRLAGIAAFRNFRIRLGEPGEGALRISGPDCNSSAAQEMLLSLDARLDQIEWVYDAAL